DWGGGGTVWSARKRRELRAQIRQRDSLHARRKRETLLAAVDHEPSLGKHRLAGMVEPALELRRAAAFDLDRPGLRAARQPQQQVDLVLVGADRITANGDVANKVGTYGVALAARAHGIPLYVAAPWSTIDPATATGRDLVIEHRHAEELGELPAGVPAWNPAFDVTPRALVHGYLTDRGFVTPPFLS
ncbi:MAG: hypothetical protein ACK5AK_05235, partial [Gemmatimonas sp.]